jgi:pyrimidine-nucleoside phosphorylase
LVPIIASLGLKVAKMSGRGLGFTGGTIDKLDSIRFNSNLEGDTNLDLLEKEGCFIMAQTDDLAPADGVIYSLRNSSGTVESLPLIASSVVSKKLALNTDYVFLDVKCGNGAFMKNSEEAIALSELMLDIFTKFNKKAACHITNMSQPLGRAIGNGIEIKAVIDFLNNKPESNEITELIEEFASDMILCTNIANTKDEAIGKVREVISNGTAYKKFIS